MPVTGRRLSMLSCLQREAFRNSTNTFWLPLVGGFFVLVVQKDISGFPPDIILLPSLKSSGSGVERKNDRNCQMLRCSNRKTSPSDLARAWHAKQLQTEIKDRATPGWRQVNESDKSAARVNLVKTTHVTAHVARLNRPSV